MGDYTTMIGIRDYHTRDRQIRLPATDLGPYHALVARAFHDFQHDPNRYTLHLHFQQYTSCRGDDLLDPREWDAGIYLIGGAIEFFAHFVDMGLQRAPGGGISPSARSSMILPPPVSSRAPTPTFGVLPPIPPPVNRYLMAPPQPLPGLGRSPSERRPDPQGLRTRRNGNSTTIYALAPPMPSSHYLNARYCSAPWVFIPVPPGPDRPRTHPQQYAEPFPEFRFPHAARESRSPSTEYEFDEGAENSPEREEEQGESQRSEDGLFVPEGDGVDMAAALAWDEDEDEGGGSGEGV